jgi:glycosyltransferase involved in cell wall biosynthesis
MVTETQSPRLRILHVLTLNGPNGEYGGPVRVARELCSELNRRGHQTHIISGAREESQPIAAKGLKESYLIVKPISNYMPVSSLWSWKLIKNLSREIKQVDLVHIHFARDLIAFLAALISILNRKPFVTQTHGMIIFDGRLSTKIIDLVFTRPLLNQSKTNLVLTERELIAMKQLGVKIHSKILRNGISVSKSPLASTKAGNRIIFCSRLDKRKGVDKFILLAKSFETSKLKFEIFGPEGGELGLVQEAIQNAGPSGNLQYKGTIKSENVQELLKNADVLILPSKDEPFPMVVLEALAVGTPVLVMPSCGISEDLKEFNSNFVAKSENMDGLIYQTSYWLKLPLSTISRTKIANFARESFGIEQVVNLLIDIYETSLNLKITE